jgi:hypothetical protein
MSSSDLAAWVQAFGSVAAILAAYALANKQFNDATTLQREAARAERVRRYEVLHGLVEAALDEFSQVVAALRASEPEKWFEQNSGHELMAEFHHAMQQISPLDMPTPAGARALIKFRDLLATAAWNAKAALEHGSSSASEYSACVAAMEDNLNEVRAEHQKLLAEFKP